jgi:Fe-S-cluster-containing hydrogenase component 2
VVNDGALEKTRRTSTTQWMVINRYETEKGEVFVKNQCMHCYQAACATACPTEAMNQKKEGPVVWDGDKCIGCRYCMTSCPFDIPKFEYESWNPKIQKCTMCFEHEVGGTGYIYLSAVPFEQLGFRTDLGDTPYPEYTKEFLYAVPMVLFGVPAFLLGLNALVGGDPPVEDAEFRYHGDEKGGA